MTARWAKAHLGAGWRFPVAPANGALGYSEHETNIEESIHIILATEPGERPMLSRFGAGLRTYVFEPNSPVTRAAIAAAVQRALIDWEPRIEVERVDVVPDDRENNKLLIHVDYVVRSTNTAYNRVYPFYLFEGGE